MVILPRSHASTLCVIRLKQCTIQIRMLRKNTQTALVKPQFQQTTSRRLNPAFPRGSYTLDVLAVLDDNERLIHNTTCFVENSEGPFNAVPCKFTIRGGSIVSIEFPLGISTTLIAYK